MDDVRKIAEGLSKAERAAVLSNDNWTMDDLAARNPKLSKSLHSVGITYAMLSPLGEAVRAYLKDQAHG